MRRPVTALLLATSAFAVLGVFAVSACSDDGADEGGDAGLDVTDLGVCATPYDAAAGKFPHSALPTGQSCTANTSCHMPIDDCASDWSENPVGPNLDEYECLCTSGAWVCTLAIKVDTTCGETSDGSADSSLDATADASDDSPIDAPLDSAIDSPADSPPGANDSSLLDSGSDAADAL